MLSRYGGHGDAHEEDSYYEYGEEDVLGIGGTLRTAVQQARPDHNQEGAVRDSEDKQEIREDLGSRIHSEVNLVR